MLSVEEARARILSVLPPPRTGEVGIEEAFGRVLAGDVVAGENLPPFDRAAMDGYAVRAADVAHATPREPARLRVTGAVAAGHLARGSVEPGTAIGISTGAPLPDGADAVVRFEETREEADGWIKVLLPVAEGENVGPAGEDLRAGTLVLRQGTYLRAPEIGVLSALGWARVPVVASPRVAIVTTGDEVVEVNETPGPGQVRNSTAHVLAALVRQCGGVPVLRGRVKDTDEAVAAALEACRDFDVIMTTGGVSVGRHDVIRDVLAAIGAELVFWRVNIKPGKNIAVGRRGSTLYLGMSGNPAAAMVTFEVVVRPALMALAGRPGAGLLEVQAVMDGDVEQAGGLERYLRAHAYLSRGGIRARLVGSQLPSVLSSMTQANALVVIPAGNGSVRAGDPVKVLIYEGAERSLFLESEGVREPLAAGG